MRRARVRIRQNQRGEKDMENLREFVFSDIVVLDGRFVSSIALIWVFMMISGESFLIFGQDVCITISCSI